MRMVDGDEKTTKSVAANDIFVQPPQRAQTCLIPCAKCSASSKTTNPLEHKSVVQRFMGREDHRVIEASIKALRRNLPQRQRPRRKLEQQQTLNS
jgi:hypothetical protein